jgi:hypothetical protein
MAGDRIDGIALASIGAGALFLYAGIKGKSIPAALQAIVQGKSPATVPQSAPISQTSGNTTGAAADTAIAGVDIPASVAAGSEGNSVAANKVLGELMAAGYGWVGTQWQFLESGWEEESGWSTTAANQPSDPYNGAYGIPQSNPGTKMASAGADWKTSAETQIAWGLAYIKATYGSPDQVPLWSANGPLPGYEGY